MSDRILFLDCDGVINCRASWKRGPGFDKCDADKRDRLLHVVETTGCKIVLSSTWRTDGWDGFLVRRLFDFGIGQHFHEDWRTIEAAPSAKKSMVAGRQFRGGEIAEWLSRHPEVVRYAIVDDDSDMLPEQRPFFVQTSFETGMLDKHAERLIALLLASTKRDR